ncbi:MAG: hypothetical protein GYA14_08245 [Ignavibacteria bacterium]|nr:hypothetical protein [Ignavibacteria bacterium]
MKKYFLFLIILLTASGVFGQVKEEDKRRPKPWEKIEQLEKAKLIEVLDLDEQTAIKFFSRRKEHQKQMRDLMDSRENMLKELEKNIKEKGTKDGYYTDQVNKILEIEKQMSLAKQNFFKSLNDLFTPEKIAKLTVFEYKFRREIAQSLMGRKRPED